MHQLIQTLIKNPLGHWFVFLLERSPLGAMLGFFVTLVDLFQLGTVIIGFFGAIMGILGGYIYLQNQALNQKILRDKWYHILEREQTRIPDEEE